MQWSCAGAVWQEFERWRDAAPVLNPPKIDIRKNEQQATEDERIRSRQLRPQAACHVPCGSDNGSSAVFAEGSGLRRHRSLCCRAVQEEQPVTIATAGLTMCLIVAVEIWGTGHSREWPTSDGEPRRTQCPRPVASAGCESVERQRAGTVTISHTDAHAGRSPVRPARDSAKERWMRRALGSARTVAT